VQGVGNFATMLPLYWMRRQRPLRYRKNKAGLIICNSIYLPYGAKIVKIGPANPEMLQLRASEEAFRCDTKLVARPIAIICTQNAFMWCKNCKNRTWFNLCFACHTKLVAMSPPMSTLLEESEKLDWIEIIHANAFHLMKKS